MLIEEHVPLKPKTTMRVGGTARYFADCFTKRDVEEAAAFAAEKALPLVLLGGGSNTIFTDEELQAVVMRIKADAVNREDDVVTIETGKTLAVLINELAEQGFDLSALTGIPGSIGGAVFGNAGQGPKGTWIDSFVQSVTVYEDGQWKEVSNEVCGFAYRESGFKSEKLKVNSEKMPPIIWSAQLKVPKKNPAEIQAEIERLIQRRIETQPHRKTAGSCFKAVGDTPAWQLIDAVGLRGHRVGDVSVSTKHANFLMNEGKASYSDAVAVVEAVTEAVDEELEVEMRFIQADGSNHLW